MSIALSGAAREPLRVLVAGPDNMGRSHALAYHRHPGFNIELLVNRSPTALPVELASYPQARDFLAALRNCSADHQALCEREQAFVYDAILGDVDLDRHWTDAVQSLRSCLAADESVRSGNAVSL